MRRAGVIAAALALASMAGAALAQRSAGDEQRRLVEAQRASAAAATRASRLTEAAAGERRAAERAQTEEAALGARVEAAAADLDAAEARSALVAGLFADQRARLAAKQAPAARLLGALAAMARRPALASLAQPGTVADQVHVRAVLGVALPVVRARTEALRVEVARTRQLQAAATLAAGALRDGRSRLEHERTALAQLEAQHRERATSLGRSAMSEADRALALGEQARDLVDRLGERASATATAADLAALAGPLPRPLAPGAALPVPARGIYRLPVEGRLVTGVGEISAAGVRSRGLTFAVVRGAAVVAPAAGVVRYAGRFRRYGVIVIVDHGSGWTSLVTGLGGAEARVGETVTAGQRIGVAGAGDDPQVTVELRRRGEPVDAAALIG